MKAIVLRTAGTNCDQETAHALRMAGAEPEIIHVNQLLSKKVDLEPYRLMIIPGGFSYGDDVAAGKILANELRFKLREALDKFVAQGDKTLSALEKNRQVIFRYQGANPNGSVNAIAGICNSDGNVVGLMPHPERHVSRSQHPEWTRFTNKSKLPVGLQFFQAAVLN